MRRQTIGIAVVALIALAPLHLFASGQAEMAEYPSEAITLIVPFGAGGGMDTTARAMAQISDEYLGVPLVVVNRTGGSGTIAVTEASRAEADGYTLLVADTGTLHAVPLMQEVEYSLDDFDVVSGVNLNDVILITRTDSAYETVSDLANATERVRYGTVGAGSVLHALATAFVDQTGINATNVPFGSTAETVTAVLSGIIDVGVGHPNQARTGLADGTLRAIGVFSDQRIAALPNVPTMREEGYDLSLQVYNVLLAPAGIPADRLAILREAFVGILSDPFMQENAAGRNLVLYAESGEVVGPKLTQDASLTEDLFRELGLLAR